MDESVPVAFSVSKCFSKEVKSPLLFDWTWFKIETIRIRVDNVEMKRRSWK